MPVPPPVSPDPAHQGRARPFRGWFLVAAVFLILTTLSGLGVYALSVYLHAFVAEGRFAIREVSFATGAFAAAGGLASPGIGRLLERYDVRRVMTAGVALMVAALLALRWVDGVAELVAFYAVFGLGYTAASVIPCTTVVARWFSAKRSEAMSIASTGNSFGAVVLTPPAAWLVGRLGLDDAGMWIAAAVVLGALPLTWFVLRSWPRDVGLAALGETPGPARQASAAAGDAVYRAAVRTRFYRLVVVAFMLGMAAHVGGQTHVYNLLMERDGNAGLASLAIAVMAAASVLARFLAVWALRRMSNRAFIGLLLAVQAVALAGCALSTGTAVLLGCIAVFGATLGNFVTMQSLLLAEAFGVTAYARLFGTSRFLGVIGVLIGPGLMGVLFEREQAYVGAYLAAGAISLAGFAVLRTAGPTPGERAGPR